MNARKKQFKLAPDEIKRLIPAMGVCYASDRITVDGMKVGYLYREESDEEGDSGWRFFSGDETEEYTTDPDNFGIYEVNTICNYDPAIIPLLDSPVGSAFSRFLGSDFFEPEEFEEPEE